MARKKSLEQWIQESLTDKDKEKPCTGFDLKHQIGQSMRHVHAAKLGKEVTAKHLAALFQDKAETCAQDIAGVQYFVLNAYYGENSEPEASLTFVVTGATDWGNATEGPDEKGKTQQQMRLTEMIVQGSFAQNKFAFESMAKMVEQATLGMRQTQSTNLELITALHNLILQSATRNHEYEIEMSKQKMLGQAMGLAAPLLNTLTGTTVFPESTEDSALIGALIKFIPESALRQLFGQLPASVAGPLAARFDRELEKVEKGRRDKIRTLELTRQVVNGAVDDEGIGDEEPH